MDVTPESGAGHEPDLDLRPRAGADVAVGPSRRARARWPGVVALVSVLVVAGFVVTRALDDATLFFRNVDEAVERRAELADTRFRLQGTVVPGTVEEVAGGVVFEVQYNGVVAVVDHTGDPPELFQDDIPVVLEGRWSSTADDAVFLSDRMLVRHDENYDADHSDRLDEAVEGGRYDEGEPPASDPR